ncbi:hypothetical protein WOLCODRAFT_73732 [Wolfiporia cocos MD-104 SS10]|uniref:DUF4440 domain-containing protein n=1 Tax=Wolfiporia cocos (strain MD-104) TaxID=742152 RepID=A0A2H3JKY0_WOLCO|nr:hypothetical protein WOLCODRAFT_73732 [Wolfiporia cocos MD-104 SS10]
MSISLGPGPVIIPLTAWAEDSISALFKATADNFDSAFDSFLAEDVHITVNGKHLTREQYKQQILGEKALERTANVTFLNSVEVPKDENKPAQAGTVGLFYKAQIIEKLFVLGAPAGRTITSSVNLT